MEMSFFTMPS